MQPDLHPLAPHHLPPFVTGPGETDVLLNVMILLLIGAVLMIGNLYLQLHALPERRAHHRTNRAQFEIVAVLSLLALFTHQHLFWIAALLLAMVQFPDFSTPLNRIADSLEDRTRRSTPAEALDSKPEPEPEPEPERQRPQVTEVKSHLTKTG